MVILLCAVVAIYFGLRNAGILERLHLRRTLGEVGSDVAYGKNWLINANGLRGTMPVYASLTSEGGVRYFLYIQHDQTAQIPDNEMWIPKTFIAGNETRSLTYMFLGPFPPKTSKSITAYHRLENFPYVIGVTADYDPTGVANADDLVMADICKQLGKYEAALGPGASNAD